MKVSHSKEVHYFDKDQNEDQRDHVWYCKECGEHIPATDVKKDNFGEHHIKNLIEMETSTKPDTEVEYRYAKKSHRCSELIELDPFCLFEIESGYDPEGPPAMTFLVSHGERMFSLIKYCPFCGKRPKPHVFNKKTGEYVMDSEKEV